jgi:hypothetical protein
VVDSDSPTYQWRKNSVNISGATNSTLSGTVASVGAAGTYDCVVTESLLGTATTSSTATLTVPTTTSITGQPSSLTRCTGTSATFTVTATGEGLTYQWKKDGVNVSGTSASYTISSVAVSDAGSYTCAVTGTCGTVTSSAAVLTVNTSPAITDQPDNITACTGDNATFSVTATGSGLTYQWTKDEANITGATSSSYSISGIDAFNAGDYQCVIIGTCATVYSTVATLTTGSASSNSRLKNPDYHYSFDNTPIDSMLTGKNLATYGNATYSSTLKQVGTHAGYFDGVNDYFKIPTIDLNDTVTIAFWLRVNSTVTSNKGLFCSSDTLDISDNLNIRAVLYNGLSDQVKVSTGSQSALPNLTLTIGDEWNHLIFTIIRKSTNSVLRAWHNGNRCTMVGNDSTLLLDWQTLGRFHLGVDVYVGEDFAGQIDELRIYSGFIPTETQIDSLYDLSYKNTFIPCPSVEPQPQTGRKKILLAGKTRNILLANKERDFGTHNFSIVDPLNIGINAAIGIEDYDGVCPSGSTTLTDADCARNRFTTAPLKKIQDTTGYAKVYIDPTTDASGTGTLADPYDSWSDVSSNLTSYTAYLFKRGTTYTATSKLVINNIDNILIGSYGSGNRSIISTSANRGIFDIFYSNNVTVRDIKVTNPYFTTSTNTSFQIDYSSNVDVYNCEIQYQHMAVRSGSSSYRVIGCDIHDILLDAFMVYYGSYIELAWNKVYDINLAYFVDPDYNYSPGDFIQISGDITQLYIHHDSIDRSDTGNKSIFQIGNYDVNMIVEFCKLGAPNWNGIVGQNPQVMNAGLSTGSIVFRNNHIRGNMPENTGRIHGLYGFGANDTIIGNIFEGLGNALYIRDGGVVNNNTFYDNTTAIYAGSSVVLLDVRNNIFWNNASNLTNVTATQYSNNLTTDPSFVNAANNDFHLQSISSAINNGTVLLYREYDLYGTEITTPDIGAVEYTP